jgi:hypothetical protein
VAAAESGGFVSVTPYRVLDTRTAAAPLASGQSIPVLLNVPADAVAVALNVTATEPTGPGFLAVYPHGTPTPSTSNVNFVTGQTVPNMVVVGVGSGAVDVYNFGGSTHVLVDVMGWFTGSFAPMATPRRLLDTRDAAPLGQGEIRSLIFDVLDATGVVLNVTATNPTKAGYLTVFPHGSAAPTASNVNFEAGQTVPNLVTVGISNGGFDVFNALGVTDVVVDLFGYYRGTDFHPVRPFRVMDSRSNQCGPTMQPGEVRRVATGQAGTAVALNVTAVNPQGAGFLTVYPSGAGTPSTSNVNYVRGKTVANMSLVAKGSDGYVALYNYGAAVDVVIDVAGSFGSGGAIPISCVIQQPAPTPGPTPPPTPAPTPPAYAWESGGAGFNVNIYADHPLNSIPGWTDANYRATNLTNTAKSWDVYVHWTTGAVTTDYLSCTPVGGSQDSQVTDYTNSGSRITSIEAYVAIDWHHPGC